MVTGHLRRPESAFDITALGNSVYQARESSASSVSRINYRSADPFNDLSSLPFQDASTKFWWYNSGDIFANMLKRACYPIPQQYLWLLFYYHVVLPELGPSPAEHADRTSFSADTINTSPAAQALVSPGPEFKSYMTDDHSPIELSWVFDNDRGAVVRFVVDPVRRQAGGSPRGAIGILEDLGHSNCLGEDFNLDWSSICASSLTLSTSPHTNHPEKRVPKYPSQYFVGFGFSSLGIIAKAYFLPETRAAATSTSPSALITSCINALSTPVDNLPDTPDLLTPWEQVHSFFVSLPSTIAPELPIVAVDCVPSSRNRLKVYARTPRSTLTNLRRFLTLGRDPSCTSPATQRVLEQATLLWNLLFPALASPHCEDVEPRCEPHPTGGLVLCYELRPGHAEPFPKVYLPVRHWCSSDEQVVGIMESFFAKTGNFKAAKHYAQDVRETFTHRPLSSRVGIHTYISLAVKREGVQVTSYFNPECYAPERVSWRA